MHEAPRETSTGGKGKLVGAANTAKKAEHLGLCDQQD